MIRYFVAFFLLLLLGITNVAADDLGGAIKLHALGKEYQSFSAYKEVLPVPLQCFSLRIKSGVEYGVDYNDGKLVADRLPYPEQKRVLSLLAEYLSRYLRTFSGCNLDAHCDYQVVVACEQRASAQIEDNANTVVVPVPSADLNWSIDKPSRIQPLVQGSYYLINLRDNSLIFHRQINGVGAVLDIAIDDFARKLALDFSRSLKDLQ